MHRRGFVTAGDGVGATFGGQVFPPGPPPEIIESTLTNLDTAPEPKPEEISLDGLVSFFINARPSDTEEIGALRDAALMDLLSAKNSAMKSCVKILRLRNAGMAERQEKLREQGRAAQEAVQELEAKFAEAEQWHGTCYSRRESAQTKLVEARDRRKTLSRWATSSERAAADQAIQTCTVKLSECLEAERAALDRRNRAAEESNQAIRKLQELTQTDEEISHALAGTPMQTETGLIMVPEV